MTTVQVDDESHATPSVRQVIRPKRWAIVGFCLLALVLPLHAFASAADRVLGDFHDTSSTGEGPSVLAAPLGGHSWMSSHDLETITESWTTYEEALTKTLTTTGQGDQFEKPATEVSWYFWAKGLSFLIGAVGFGLLWRFYRERDDADGYVSGDTPLAVISRGIRHSKLTIGLIAICGFTGVVAQILLGQATSAALAGSSPGLVLWFANVCSWASVVTLGLFLLSFLLPIAAALIADRGTAFSRLATAIVVVAAVVLVLRQNQGEDGLRGMEVGTFLGSLVAAVAAGAAVALAGSRGLELNDTPVQKPLPPPKPPAEGPDQPGKSAEAVASKPAPGTAGGVLARLGRWLAAAVDRALAIWRDRTPSMWALAPLAGIGITLFVIGWRAPGLHGLLVPGVLLVALYILSVPIEGKVHRIKDPDTSPHPITWLEAAAAIGALLPLIVASNTILAKSIDPLPRLLADRGPTVAIILVAFAACLVLPVISYALSTSILLALNSEEENGERRLSLVVGATVFILCVIVGGVLYLDEQGAFSIDPGTISVAVGSMSVVLAFAFVLGGIAATCRLAGDLLTPFRWTAPAALRAINVRRPPLLAGLFIWLLLASVLGQEAAHEVRRASGTDPATGVKLEEQVEAWKQRALAKDPRSPQEKEVNKVPLVIVAASGGGIRAAYWTSLVLDCIFERVGTRTSPCSQTAASATERRPLMYAASGASGGSVGIVEWLAYLHAYPDKAAEADVRWIRQALDQDFLAPTFAAMFFRDGPDLLLRSRNRTGDDDRAAALEQAWERPWSAMAKGDAALTSSFLQNQRVGTDPKNRPPDHAVVEPLALLNSTNDANGCRIEVSVLDAAIPTEGRPPSNGCVGVASASPLGGTVDLTDGFVCGPKPEDPEPGNNDVRRSTAASMSARFPFVTPSGWLTSCNRDDRVFAVDGGYLDTSAASAPAALWPRVAAALCPNGLPTCEFEPVFVQIDNDPGDAAQHLADETSSNPRTAPPPPDELLVPLKGLSTSQGGQADAARAQACLTFSKEGRWVHLAVAPTPGAAPPLGWVLSAETRDGLERQLTTTGDNAKAFDDLHHWLDEGVPDKGAPPALDATAKC